MRIIKKVSQYLRRLASLPFVSDSFHCIVSNDTWEHLARPALVLQECSRVLQSAGVLTVSALPYYLPWGAHAWKWLPVPWLQVFFPRRLLFRLIAFIERHHDSWHVSN